MVVSKRKSAVQMSSRIAGKTETRTALLETGMAIMVEKGYTNTGIQEILNTLSVPKGSFYHYFDSKENYAVAIIQHFDQHYCDLLIQTLRNQEQTPIQRLQSYCQTGRRNLLEQNCRKGCLIGNLSQEMADQSEVLRKELSIVMSKWRDIFASCIQEGQTNGEILTNWSAEHLAELFLSGWSGAITRAKTLKSIEPIDIFMDVMFTMMRK